MNSKPFSQACANNCDPIAEVLARQLHNCSRVLEIGSGTGQHAVYFSARFPFLQWQTSDRVENHPGIKLWIESDGTSNVHSPVTLDVSNNGDWDDIAQTGSFDAVYSANTAHIMHWTEVVQMFQGAGRILGPGGQFLLYGPFNRNGMFTSDSNARFDNALRMQDPGMGIRDDAEICSLAEELDLGLSLDIAMPANNRLLVFIKS